MEQKVGTVVKAAMGVVDMVAEGMVAVGEGPMEVEAAVAAAMVAEVVGVVALGGVGEAFLAGVAKLGPPTRSLALVLHIPCSLDTCSPGVGLYLLWQFYSCCLINANAEQNQTLHGIV